MISPETTFIALQPVATPVPRQIPDPVWDRLRGETSGTAQDEPMLAGYLHDTVLRHRSLDSALSYFLAGKLASRYLAAVSLRDVFSAVSSTSTQWRTGVSVPLCKWVMQPILALQMPRGCSACRLPSLRSRNYRRFSG